jgi:hypothetical protein
MGRLQNILLAKIASFTNPLQKTATPCAEAKEIHWVARADARNGIPCLKYEIWPRNELDIVVSKSAKSASYGRGSLVCGLWLAGGGCVGSVPTYVLGTFYIRFFCTRATISVFIMKPTVGR